MWRVVQDGTFHKEPHGLDSTGNDIFLPIDTKIYCYVMTCWCGRLRYAKPNGIHEVFLCRVCTNKYRKAKRRKSRE